MIFMGIDPGTNQSAWVMMESGVIKDSALMQNDELLEMLREPGNHGVSLAVEMIASYGMPVGAEVFETCVLIGRIVEIASTQNMAIRRIYRKDIKVHLCGTTKAKDANVRQALIDKYGPQGTKKNPGPTYGMKADLWAALAIADYALNNPQ